MTLLKDISPSKRYGALVIAPDGLPAHFHAPGDYLVRDGQFLPVVPTAEARMLEVVSVHPIFEPGVRQCTRRDAHVWPAELDAHAGCELCGLPYTDWSDGSVDSQDLDASPYVEPSHQEVAMPKTTPADVTTPSVEAPSPKPATSSLWDDPEVVKAAVGSTFVKFEKPGDGVVGTIARLSRHTWEDGSVAVKIEFVEGDVPTLTASQFRLVQALFELRPVVGERLDVSYLGGMKRAGKTPKFFRVSVTDASGDVRTIDQSSDLLS